MICATRTPLFSAILTALFTINTYALQTNDQPAIRTHDLGGRHAYDSATFYKDKQFLAYGCFAPDQSKPSFKRYTITDGTCVDTPLDNSCVSQLHLTLLNSAYPMYHHDRNTVTSCYTQAYQICIDSKSIQAFSLRNSQQPIIHRLQCPLEPGSSIAATDLLDKPIVAISYPSESIVRYFDLLNDKQTKDIFLPNEKIVQVSLPPSSGGREKVHVALVLANTAPNTFTCVMRSLAHKKTVNDGIALCVYKRAFVRNVSAEDGISASMVAQWNSSCRYVTWLLRTQSTAHTQDTHLPITLYNYKLIAHDPEQFTQEHHAYAHASFTIASSRELPPAGAQPDSRLKNIIIGSTLVKNLQFSWAHVQQKKRSCASADTTTVDKNQLIFHSYQKVLTPTGKRSRQSKQSQPETAAHLAQIGEQSEWKTFELSKHLVTEANQSTILVNAQPVTTVNKPHAALIVENKSGQHPMRIESLIN